MVNIHRIVLGSLVTAGSPLRSATAAASAAGLPGTTTTCTRSVCRTRTPRKPRASPSSAIAPADHTASEQRSNVVSDAAPQNFAGRDPDKWLFRRMLQASAKLWTRISHTQLGSSGTNRSTTPPSQKTQTPIELARARKIVNADIEMLQATGAGLWRRVRDTGRPLWQQARGVLDIGAGLMRNAAQRLGGTDVGRRIGEPVRRFMEESSAAKCERDKYIESVRSMKGSNK